MAMNERELIYWLQGKFELDESCDTFTEEQISIIKEHIELTRRGMSYWGAFVEAALAMINAYTDCSSIGPDHAGDFRKALYSYMKNMTQKRLVKETSSISTTQTLGSYEYQPELPLTDVSITCSTIKGPINNLHKDTPPGSC